MNIRQRKPRKKPAAAAVNLVLGNLARELEQTLNQLPGLPAEAGQLDDACARLDHVVKMTETATHRTLDLTEQSRELVQQLRHILTKTDDASASGLLEQVQKNLSDIALTQSYQDLTGQMIARVVGIVRRVHEGFDTLGLLPPKPAATSVSLNGPSISGLDCPAVSQHDADDLLLGLGL